MRPLPYRNRRSCGSKNGDAAHRKFLAGKHGGSGCEWLYRLYGYMQQACTTAGMMRPRGWSTG
jgi:hypothetical protein